MKGLGLIFKSGLWVILILLAGETFGQPQGRGRGGSQANSGRHAFLSERLDLSEEQESKWSDLRTDHLQAMLPLRNQLNEQEARLQTLTTSDKSTEKEIDQTIEQIGNTRMQMMKEQISHRREVRGMLNEDQKTLFDSFRQQPMRPGNGRGQNLDCPRGR